MINLNIKPVGSWVINVPAGGLDLPLKFYQLAADALVADIKSRMNRGVGADNQLMKDNAAGTRSGAGFAGLLGKEKKAGNYGGKQMGARTGWKRKRPSVMTGLLRDNVTVKEAVAGRAVVHVNDVRYPGSKYGTTTLMAANFLQFGTSPHVILPRGPWMLKFPTSSGIVMAKKVHHPGTVPRVFFGISPVAEKKVLQLAEAEIKKIIEAMYK